MTEIEKYLIENHREESPVGKCTRCRSNLIPDIGGTRCVSCGLKHEQVGSLFGASTERLSPAHL